MKILFFINSLRGGGAEKSLVKLVNHLNRDKYEITVLLLFNKGVHIRSLNNNVNLKYVFKYYVPGVTQLLKILSPRILYKMFVRGKYDVVMSFLQGVTTRIVAGAPNHQIIVTRLGGTFIKNFHNKVYRSTSEMIKCYSRFTKIVGVSEDVSKSFIEATGISFNVDLLYNIFDSDSIIQRSFEPVHYIHNREDTNFITAGSFFKVKGYYRLLLIFHKLLQEGYSFHLHMLGEGDEFQKCVNYVIRNGLSDYVSFWGYQENPYKYIRQADVYICSSYTEGFSGTVAESIILGIPVLTTDCSSMKEMIGENNERGLIVDNDDNSLYRGIKIILDHPDQFKHCKHSDIDHNPLFNIDSSVKRAESFFDSLHLA